MKRFYISLFLYILCKTILSAQTSYFVDGYHGGVFGHYPVWQTSFMMEKLNEHPGWSICLEIEPETFDSVKVWTPKAYTEFVRFVADHNGTLLEFTNPTYAQPYCYNISGESLIRQFAYGIDRLRKHFPELYFSTYAVEEPCFTSALPQVLKQFGFRYAVLKNPGTCYGGYAESTGRESINWIGPDSTAIPTIPRYDTELLEENSTWQTTAWINSPKYLRNCFKAGIKHPVGMCYQDAGWENGPWLGSPQKSRSNYTLWTNYIENIASPTTDNRRLSQENFRVSLMWGSQVVQRLAQEIRQTENKLIQTEKIAVLQKYFDHQPWNQTLLDGAWRGLLLSQHHDCWIVPYNKMGHTNHTWAENVSLFTAASQRLCDTLVGNNAPYSGKIRIYNSTGKARKELVSYPLPASCADAGIKVTDPTGRKTISQKNANNNLWFLAEVPALGFADYTLTSSSTQPTACMRTERLPSGKLQIESDLYRLVFDPLQGGTITSLYDKMLQKEWIDSRAEYSFNELRGNFYEEGGLMSSSQRMAELSVVENGPLSATVKIAGKVGRYPFIQYVRLQTGEPRIDMRLEIDWQSNPRIGEYREQSRWQEVRKAFYDDRYKLHLLFPVTLEKQEIYKNAPFDVCRSNLPNTFFNRWDSIKNNVVLNWVDLYGKTQDCGLTLFTDHTTSYLHGEDYPLGLTVQYSGTGLWSADYKITGKTAICYSLLPHRQRWDKSNISFENTRKQEPLAICNLPAEASCTAKSLLQLPDEGVVLSAAYYDGDDLIVRLFNEGTSGEKRLLLSFVPQQAETIALNKEKTADCRIDRRESGSEISLYIPSFGLRTIRFNL